MVLVLARAASPCSVSERLGGCCRG